MAARSGQGAGGAVSWGVAWGASLRRQRHRVYILGTLGWRIRFSLHYSEEVRLRPRNRAVVPISSAGAAACCTYVTEIPTL